MIYPNGQDAAPIGAITQVDELLLACSTWVNSVEQIDGTVLAGELGQLRRGELARTVEAIEQVCAATRVVAELVDVEVVEFDAEPAEMAEAIAALAHSSECFYAVQRELAPNHSTRGER